MNILRRSINNVRGFVKQALATAEMPAIPDMQKKKVKVSFKSDIPDMPLRNDTLHDYIFSAFHRNEDRIAVRGDVVAVCANNCPEWIFLLLGTVQLGGIVSGLNPAYVEPEIKHHLEDCGARFLVVHAALYAKCVAAMQQIPGHSRIKQVYVFGSADCQQLIADGPLPLESFFKQRVGGIPPVSVHPQDISVLPYSSGTTGRPKGVMLSHFSNVNMAEFLSHPSYLATPRLGDAAMGILPFFHIYGQLPLRTLSKVVRYADLITIYGLMMMLVTLRQGATLVTLPKFDSRLYLQTVEKFKIKKLSVVPPLVIFLANDALVDEYDLSHVEVVMSGAACVGLSLSQKLLDRFPYMKFFAQGYGMTECGCAAAVCPTVSRAEIKHGAAGVVSVETGEDLAANGVGEIWLRSPTLMKGYLNNPKATAETIDEDGWLHSGDIGHIDSEGYIFVSDRLKELIKVKGFQVAPAELEDILLSHPSVSDAAVVGVPDELAGEVPKAFVVLKPQAPATSEDEIMKFIEGKVAHFKRFRSVEFVDSLPKSPSGKLLRRVLKQQVCEQIETTKSKL